MSFDALETSVYGSAPFDLYKFTMGDQAWYLTDGDEARVYQTQTYAPTAIKCTEIEQNRETNSGQIEVTIPLESELVAEFIAFVPPSPMWLTIYSGHDGDSEINVRFKGLVVQAKFDSECTIFIKPQLAAIRKKIPAPVYQQSCNRMHYSPQCGATEASGAFGSSWTLPVSAISGLDVTLDMAFGSDAYIYWWNTFLGYSLMPSTKLTTPSLAWGMLQAPSGQRMMIAAHDTYNVVTLKAPVVGLQVGDTVKVVRGCRRTLANCAFYGRTASFMAADVMPKKNPFTGIL